MAITNFSADNDPAGLALPVFGERQSLRHQVTQALRAALVAGEMRPGRVYSAPALADQFGVSATPVREAMLDLAKEGLVEVVRNKGFRVKEPTPRELDEITKLRMLLEVPTVAEIARGEHGASRPDLDALRRLAQHMMALAEAGDLIAYVEADRQFHGRLLALAGNQHLLEVVNDLRGRSRLYGLHQLAERGELADSAREHEQIIDLVVAGDAGNVTKLMIQHIGHVRGAWAGPGEP
jgi:DNA-binding GntR family transcriptional regulator